MCCINYLDDLDHDLSRCGRFLKPPGVSWVASGGVRNLTGRVGSGQEVFKSHGWGRVGAG